MERGPLPINRGLPEFDPLVPSPIFGQMVIVLFGVPLQLAVNIPDVDGVPPTLKFTLPKFMSVIEKLQDCANDAHVKKAVAIKMAAMCFISIAMGLLMFEFLCRL